MEVTGKYLLNQAESILKDRRQDSKSRVSKDGQIQDAGKTVKADGLRQGVFESRLMNLQESLGEIQKDYSREQTRFAYLTSNPDKISKDLLFDGEALFPELNSGGSLEALKRHVEDKLKELTRNLKGKQVEMENLLALNFNSVPGVKPEDLTGLEGMKNLDPARVARLTR